MDEFALERPPKVACTNSNEECEAAPRPCNKLWVRERTWTDIIDPALDLELDPALERGDDPDEDCPETDQGTSINLHKR